MTQPKDRKLDLFQALNSLSRKDRDFYNSLSDEEKKEFLPTVIMRWMSGTDDIRQIIFLNELVNPFVFSMYEHKELLADLLVVSASGSSQRYKWQKMEAKATRTPVAVEVVSAYLGYNTERSKEALKLLPNEEVLQYAEALGYQPDQISKLKKELKALKE